MAKVKLALKALNPLELMELTDSIITRMTGNANFTTPVLPAGYTNYSFDVQLHALGCECAAAEAELKILMGGTNVTGATTNVIVGQPINLTCTLTGGTINTVTWNLPATNYYFGDFVADGQVGRVDPVTNFNSTNMNFYFKDSPGSGVKLTVFCYVSATVNGVATNINRFVKFTIIRPTADLVVVKFGDLLVSTQFLAAPGLPAIHLGDYFNAQGVRTPGVGFRGFNLNTSGYPGRWSMISVVSNGFLAFSLTNNTAFRYQTNGLDTFYPYSTTNKIINGQPSIIGLDSPGFAPVSNRTELVKFGMVGNFELFLMFTPTNFPSAREVPIKWTTWSFYGFATNGSGNLGWDATTQPTLALPVGPGIHRSIHPHWNHNITNRSFQQITPW